MHRREFLAVSSISATGFLLASKAMALNQPPSPATNPFLIGNYAPVLEENTTSYLEVEGYIPPDINGVYFRNGPNPLYPTSPYFWLDGDGMIHSVEIKGGSASYRNRFVMTDGLHKEIKAGQSLYGGIVAGPPFKNAANTSLVKHHGKLLATWEAGLPYEINERTLKTKGQYDFQGNWQGTFTAHPKIDSHTGEMFCFGYNLFSQPYLRYGVLDRSGNLIHDCSIDLPYPAMMHDFAVTENYAVFFHMPLVYGEGGFAFKPELGARVGILPKYGRGQDIRWFKIEPKWAFHFSNAFEDGNIIRVTGSSYDRWPLSHPYLREWRIDLTKASVHESAFYEWSSEFPTIHPNLIGKYNRYTYFAHYTLYGEGKGIVKYDSERRITASYSYGTLKRGGEPVFVPRPGARGEDDGYILCFVHSGLSHRSHLVVLGAKSLTELAKIRIPYRVPFGLHGIWLEV